jgi:hypothetical protein
MEVRSPLMGLVLPCGHELVAGLALTACLQGCGTALVTTQLRAVPAAIEELRRGGAALHCHELNSIVFAPYLVCPGEDASVGVMETGGRLGFSCPDLRAKRCRQLVRQIQCAGAFAGSSSILP